jgi:hypothetical protein
MVENITPAAKVFHCKSVGLAVIANVKRGQADLPDLVFIPFLTAEPVREKKRTNPQHPLHIILVLVQDALFGAHKTQGVLKKGIVVYYQMNCYSI